MMMRKFYTKHQQKINYLLVGGWNTVFGYLAFVSLYYLFNRWVHYLILVVAAHVISITNAYVGYKIFVFKTKGNYLKEYLRFYVVYGLALMLNLVLLPLVVEIFRISPVIGQAIVMGMAVVFNYLGHKHFSFRVGS